MRALKTDTETKTLTVCLQGTLVAPWIIDQATRGREGEIRRLKQIRKSRD